MNNKLIAGLALVAVLISGFAVLRSGKGQTVLGALAGPDVYSFLTVHGVLTQGGGITATSTTQATVLTGSDFDTENVIDITWTNAVAGGNITLPASSTLPLSTDVGSMRTIWIRNATTTAATALTIVGNTGTLLKVASSTDQIGGGAGAQKIYGDTDGNNMARIDFIRKANSDIIANFTFFRDN